MQLALLTAGCTHKIGPTTHYFKKDGQLWYTSKIYGYPDGKRKLAQIDTYKKQNGSPESTMYDLQESILFYELWPNYEWKLVSKTGFTKYKNGTYFLNIDSVVVPDNVIYKYFDKDLAEQIEVYKNGKRIKYKNSITLNGKYCEDLGFGWYCIDFRKDGHYKEVGGHSYSTNTTKGKWVFRNDTLVLISIATKKIESDTSLYIFKSDSLYSISFDNRVKRLVRGKPLIKQ